MNTQYWLVYEPCPDCQARNCLQCVSSDRHLTIRAVQATEPPPNAINGPCDTPQDLLDRMVRFFAFDPETGIMYFKATRSEAA